jgi:tRNA-splicing endonuclease subunit Sen34
MPHSSESIIEPIPILLVAGPHSSESITEPIPISLVAGRYLLYDIDVVTYLRRTHNICGVLIGGIPQAPQQNVFQGLPLELLPEEAKLLVDKGIGYIVDDAAWHENHYTTLHGKDRQNYLESLRAQGLKASHASNAVARQKQERALSRQATIRASKLLVFEQTPAVDSIGSELYGQGSSEISEYVDRAASPALFDTSSSKISSRAWDPSKPLALTPSTSYDSSSAPENSDSRQDLIAPASYPLFAHLNARKYFMMPGLRFGCNYNVYPGDPLRFHSHFVATSYGWDEEIAMLDLVGGGRLGTGVKKGFLIGGEDTEPESDGDRVRTFVLEWAGM